MSIKGSFSLSAAGRCTILAALVLTFGLALVTPSRADSLYLIDSGTDELVRFDPDDGSTTVVGEVGFDYRFGGMAWHSGMNALIVISDPSGAVDQSQVHAIDPSTAESTLLGTVDVGVVEGLTGFGVAYRSADNTIYMSYASSIFIVDIQNLEAEFVTTVAQGGDALDYLAFDAESGELVGAFANIQSAQNLYAVDPETGNNQVRCLLEMPENSNFGDWPGLNNGDMTYDPSRNVLWILGSSHQMVQVSNNDACTTSLTANSTLWDADALAYVPAGVSTLAINPGLNDAWYNPQTVGQGFFINVFPVVETMFVGWFTYETDDRTGPAPSAVLGEPYHRWLTAIGGWEGSVATLDVFLTQGGVFDDPEAVEISDAESYGTMTIDFHDCSTATLTYDLFAVDESGSIPIERIVPDNDALCATLSSP